MQLDRAENFKNEEKKLKKYHLEYDTYKKIIFHIKQCCTFTELQNHPISYIYGFELLKYELGGYYSFKLSKKSGVIRLICSIDEENKILKLEYISMDHYKDFKEKLKRK